MFDFLGSRVHRVRTGARGAGCGNNRIGYRKMRISEHRTLRTTTSGRAAGARAHAHVVSIPVFVVVMPAPQRGAP
jgi:hypothetical protein